MKKKSTIESLKKDGLVTTADKVPVPEPKKEWEDVAAEVELEEKFAGKTILAFCKRFKTNPDDLMAWLMDNYGKKQTGLKSPKNEKSDTNKPERPSMSNWRKEFIEKKTGIKG